jgi:general secretion pathway protein D
MKGLVSAPFILLYDPLTLEFLSAAEGDFFKGDARQTIFKVTNDAAAGRITIGLTQVGTAPGVSGTGALLTAQFRAKKPGMASIGFTGINFRGSDGNPLDIVSSDALIEIQ